MPSKHVVTGSNPVGRAIISDPSKANLLGFFIVSPKPSIVVVIALNFVALGGVLFVIIHHYHHQAVRPLVFFLYPLFTKPSGGARIRVLRERQVPNRYRHPAVLPNISTAYPHF